MASCANHPQTAAVAYCRTCGKPLCEQCKREIRGVIYCEECLAARVADPAMASAVPPPPIPPTGPQGLGGTNPVAAAILGFIPGVGAMYNGQLAKGLIHIGVFVLTIVFTSEVNNFFGFAIPAWICYMVFDAYQTAKARQLGLPDPDFLGLSRTFGLREVHPYNAAVAAAPGAGGVSPEIQPETSDRGVPTGAYWLIGLGIFFFVVNADVFNVRLGRFLWEFVVIGVGVYLAFGYWTGTRTRRRGYCPCARCRMRCMTWPAMMVTAGVLGLLADTHVLSWHNSWPLFLIVFGAIRLAQMSASTEGHIGYAGQVHGGAAAPPPPPSTTEPNSTTTGGV